MANRVKENITSDELEKSDVLIILPNALTAQRDSVPILDALTRRGISAHLVGVTTSQDEMFSSDSVAISHIYRAKGNEAPIVYVLNADYCYKGYELIKLRNILFAAITRSRAWVRICGIGEKMQALKDEIAKVQRKYQLSFKIPTQPELAKLRKLHRERTTGEKAKIKRAEKGLAEFIKAVENGDLSMEQLPPSLKSALWQHYQQTRHDADAE
jgi:superfamily I DNA and RNA helicase